MFWNTFNLFFFSHSILMNSSVSFNIVWFWQFCDSTGSCHCGHCVGLLLSLNGLTPPFLAKGQAGQMTTLSEGFAIFFRNMVLCWVNTSQVYEWKNVNIFLRWGGFIVHLITLMTKMMTMLTRTWLNTGGMSKQRTEHLLNTEWVPAVQAHDHLVGFF